MVKSRLRAALVQDLDVEHTGDMIKAMIADVQREADGEIVWSKDVGRAIGRATAKLFKESLNVQVAK